MLYTWNGWEHWVAMETKTHKHFMEEKWTAVDVDIALYNMRMLSWIEKKKKWMVLTFSLLSYVFIDIHSLHTSKASQRMAAICCCKQFFCWFFSLLNILFLFCIYVVCAKYFIVLSMEFYSWDACHTFGCIF